MQKINITTYVNIALFIIAMLLIFFLWNKIEEISRMNVELENYKTQTTQRIENIDGGINPIDGKEYKK